MPDKTNIYLWDGTVWVPALCNAAGKLIIDPSEILEDTPTNGEVAKAPTSNWAYDEGVARVAADDAEVIARNAAIATHTALPSAHHTKYTDAEAIAAAKTDPTLLNYTQGARVYHDVAQTIPHNTATTLPFNSEKYDTDSIHDNVTNNSRLTCKTAGKYLIIGTFYWSLNADGRRMAYIYLNGVTGIAAGEVLPSAVAYPVHQIPCIYSLEVNDYVTLAVMQTSGVALVIASAAEFCPYFMMQRIG